MTNFESKVKQIPYPQTSVYRNISDLSNLGGIRDRLPGDKIQEFTFDSDSVSINVPPVGTVSMRIVEREEPKCVKFETAQSPMDFNLWIQVLPVDENSYRPEIFNLQFSIYNLFCLELHTGMACPAGLKSMRVISKMSRL